MQICNSAESTRIPGSILLADMPAGWSRADASAAQVVLKGPAAAGSSAPRIAIAVSPSDPDAAATSLRDGLLRIADGCEILDDDHVPLGGRVWRRMRLRFATGPLVFGQSAWIGAVDGTTMVVVLSASDDDLAKYLATAANVVAALHN